MLEESQRDRRLLTHTNELESNGYSPIHRKKIEEISASPTLIKKVSKVECHLQRAYWQKVNTFFLFPVLSIFHIEWIILSQQYSIRCSFRWSHLRHWTSRIWKSIFTRFITCILFPLYLELSLTNFNRWNRFLWWHCSTSRIILLCSTRILWVFSHTKHHYSVIMFLLS
jgi:hypothetical protein